MTLDASIDDADPSLRYDAGVMPFVRFLPALLLAATFLVLATAQRMLLLWLLAARLKPSSAEALDVIARGARLDLACAAAALVPLALWCAILPERAWKSRLHRVLSGIAFVAGLLGIVALLVVDALQFHVHQARLAHPFRERLLVAWRMTAGDDARWQLAAVVALGCLAATAGIALLLRASFRKAFAEKMPPLVRARDLVLLLFVAVLAWGLRPHGGGFPAAPVLGELAGSSVPALAKRAWSAARACLGSPLASEAVSSRACISRSSARQGPSRAARPGSTPERRSS